MTMTATALMDSARKIHTSLQQLFEVEDRILGQSQKRCVELEAEVTALRAENQLLRHQATRTPLEALREVARRTGRPLEEGARPPVGVDNQDDD